MSDGAATPDTPPLDSPDGNRQPAPRHARGIDRLLAVMACLRDPERGCPWDVEQRFEN